MSDDAWAYLWAGFLFALLGVMMLIARKGRL